MILCVCPNPAIDTFILVDDFAGGKVNRATKELSFPGGKGIHVALGVKELGEDVAILAFWGGPTGAWVKMQCEARGITCYGPEVNDWTRTCLTIKTKNNFNETEILGPGPHINRSEYSSFLIQYLHLLDKVDLVSMSGSWPKNSFGADYSELIEKATLLNIKSYIDCSGQGLVSALEKRPYGVHINHHEAYDIYRSNNSEEIFAKMNTQCKIAALTYGGKGLYLYGDGKMVHALSKVDHVISTVGCGDSLMAGLLVARKRNYNLLETAKLAAATGAANCMREELGMFYSSDVEQLQDCCKIEVITI